MKTVVPATPTDAYGLLVTAIRDDDPVVVFAPAGALGVREDVDFDALAPVPLGVGRVHRPGDDVTVVAVGHLVHDALAVAEELADQVSVEVFDPRTLYPFDWAGLAASLERTGRLVVIDDSNRLLRHRRRDPGHRGRGDAAGRPAAPGHPAGRRGAAVRPGAGPGAAAEPGPASRGGAPSDGTGLWRHGLRRTHFGEVPLAHQELADLAGRPGHQVVVGRPRRPAAAVAADRRVERGPDRVGRGRAPGRRRRRAAAARR